LFFNKQTPPPEPLKTYLTFLYRYLHTIIVSTDYSAI
jgi:hypothetical protein